MFNLSFFLPSTRKIQTVARYAILLTLLLQASAFACRLQAIMGPRDPGRKIQEEEGRFVRASLLTSRNALLRESRQRLAKSGQGDDFYDLEDLSGLIRRLGSPDGWGLLGYPCPVATDRTPSLAHSAKPAFGDPGYAAAVESLARNPSNPVLAHVRQSDDPKSVAVDNTHPFRFRGWSMMHNGGVSGAFSPEVAAKIDAYRDRLGGGPKGQTDTERAFYYFLARLLERSGTTDRDRISLETASEVFRETMARLIALSPAKSKPIHGEVMGVQGHLETLPSCNFVLSDGQRLYAFRRVLNLYLGRKRLSNGQSLYIISSERSVKTGKGLQWLLLPENHVLALSWNEKGDVLPVLAPLGNP
jgi:predicted glutamine amidotransferase